MSTFVSTSAAAKKLAISKQQVRKLCRDGQLKSQKIGVSWIIDEKSVYSYGLKKSHLVVEDHFLIQSQSMQSMNKPIALSFFSGALGLDLGIEKAGFEIRLACESNKFCRQTIALNRPNIALIGDLHEYNADDIRRAANLSEGQEIDLIFGGPPCQAFSTAGKRKAFNDNRGNVFLKYIDIALKLNPKYFVIENVRGLLSCPLKHRPHDKRGNGFPELFEDELKGGALNFVLNRIKRANYGYSFNLYNSANFGTPQIRERVVIICSRDGSIAPFLEPSHSENGEYNLPKWKTFKSCVKGIKEHHYINFPEKRLKYYRLLKPGQNWKSLPLNLQKEALGQSFYAGGGKTGFLRRIAWHKPAPTLVTHPAMPATDLAHPEEDRPLSIEEYKRIQEFPDSWEFAGSLIEQYKQVGNAVPVSFGFAIGNLIIKLLKGEKLPQYSDFKYSRYKNTSHSSWEANFRKQIEEHKKSFPQISLQFR